MLGWELGVSLARKRAAAPENTKAEFLANFAVADKEEKRRILQQIFGIAGGHENMTLTEMLEMLESSTDSDESDENSDGENGGDESEISEETGGTVEAGFTSTENEETESLLSNVRRPRTGRR
jgi:hypothetical protein